MKISDMKQIVNLLYNEWDLGKTPSKSKGKICSWIYLFSVLEESKQIIIDKNYRKMGIGRKILEKTFEQAKINGIKNIEILTDESCDYNFYEKIGCKKIYKKVISNIEPNKLRNVTEEIGYIYEKKLNSN